VRFTKGTPSEAVGDNKSGKPLLIISFGLDGTASAYLPECDDGEDMPNNARHFELPMREFNTGREVYRSRGSKY
jgi:hypothetical protein